MLCLLLFKQCCQEFAHYFDRKPSAACIILQLVLADTPDGEVVCGGMSQHQARYGAVRAHGAMFCQGDAYARHIEPLVEEEVE